MIWLLRHGDAESHAADDAARRLTARGRDEAAAAGRALVALDLRLSGCLTSPKSRATETAEIACSFLGLEPERDERLQGGDFDPSKLAADRGDILLVGHEPDFSRAIQAKTGTRVKLSKGSLAAIDGGTLFALLQSTQLQRLVSTD